MIRALLAYLVARIRSIGHSHQYGAYVEGEGGTVTYVETPFCSICGRYSG